MGSMADQPDLGPGHTGEWVAYLQQLLAYHQVGGGFQAERYCAATEAAVRTVQRDHGLPETGHCDATTWARLTEPPQETDELTIAFSTEDQIDPPAEQIELTDVDELPPTVAVS